MGVLKEYLCRAHGLFESDAEPARCPSGCKTITRYFSQAPHVGTGIVKRSEALARFQARQMGVSDLSLDQGRSVAENNRRKNMIAAGAGQMPDMNPRTLDLTGAGSNLQAALDTVRVPAEDRGSLIGGTSTLSRRTRAYTDPRGDPKPE